jgi:transposase
MDMSRSYYPAAQELLPELTIVFDRFHVMQLVNKSVDKIRRKQQASLDKDGKSIIKGSRFLFLSNYENLDEDKQLRLDQLLEVNEPLLVMHTMKEQLRNLWDKSNRKEAKRFLGTWVLDAINAAYDYQDKSGSDVLMPLCKLALSLMRHMTGILGYFKYPITNGKMEGTNNKIKTLKRQAYGFRDKAYFRLRLLHLHAQKLQIIG